MTGGGADPRPGTRLRTVQRDQRPKEGKKKFFYDVWIPPFIKEKRTSGLPHN